jgi:hypothetical protein
VQAEGDTTAETVQRQDGQAEKPKLQVTETLAVVQQVALPGDLQGVSVQILEVLQGSSTIWVGAKRSCRSPSNPHAARHTAALLRPRPLKPSPPLPSQRGGARSVPSSRSMPQSPLSSPDASWSCTAASEGRAILAAPPLAA